MQRTDAPEEPRAPMEVRRWYVATRLVAAPVVALVCALGGVVIGGAVGAAFVSDGVIEPGTSAKMAPAVVGAPGGAIAWIVGSLACLIAYRKDRPPSRGESVMLVIAAVGLACAGLFIAALMPAFEDPWKDPRMFRLQRLIWLDTGLAAATCLVVAQRRWKPLATIALMTVTGVVFLAVAVAQFLPFLEACTAISGGDACRTGL